MPRGRRLGRLFVEIIADLLPFRRGLGQARAEAEEAGQAIEAEAAGIGEAFELAGQRIENSTKGIRRFVGAIGASIGVLATVTASLFLIKKTSDAIGAALSGWGAQLRGVRDGLRAANDEATRILTAIREVGSDKNPFDQLRRDAADIAGEFIRAARESATTTEKTLVPGLRDVNEELNGLQRLWRGTIKIIADATGQTEQLRDEFAAAVVSADRVSAATLEIVAAEEKRAEAAERRAEAQERAAQADRDHATRLERLVEDNAAIRRALMSEEEQHEERIAELRAKRAQVQHEFDRELYDERIRLEEEIERRRREAEEQREADRRQRELEREQAEEQRRQEMNARLAKDAADKLAASLASIDTFGDIAQTAGALVKNLRKIERNTR